MAFLNGAKNLTPQYIQEGLIKMGYLQEKVLFYIMQESFSNRLENIMVNFGKGKNMEREFTIIFIN